MPIPLNKVQKLTLESMVDAHTLADIVDALSDICYAKADHIEEAWQDVATARPWRQMARQLYTAGCSAARRQV